VVRERVMAGAPLVMGVDGGGSTTRVVVTSLDLQVRGSAQGTTASPSVAGRETATRTIQAAMRAALTAADAAPDDVAAVALGVAGASVYHSKAWLLTVASAVLPDALIVPSADFEIALVGALGERRGVLLLAGTGSLAYGVNAAGETALVGTWGYLVDDAGSGYWLGQQVLRAVARASDGRGPQTQLTDRVLDHLSLDRPLALIGWLYHAETARTRDVAALAPLVLAAADDGDAVAQSIVAAARDELVLAAQTAVRRLSMAAPRYAFAGGLLTSPNRLSTAVCDALGLAAIPQPQHTPVIGAALLARLALESDDRP
jgi:N-acetylglucosamine kinase-like BadF-type ATPase